MTEKQLDDEVFEGKLVSTNFVRKGVTNNKPWNIHELVIKLEDDTTRKISSFQSQKELVDKYVSATVKVIENSTDDGVYTNYQLKKIAEKSGSPQPKVEEETVEDTPKKETTGKKQETPENKMSKGEWNQKDMRSQRSMLMSYAKDLVVADKLKLDKMVSAAQTWFEFVWSGEVGDKEMKTDEEEGQETLAE